MSVDLPKILVVDDFVTNLNLIGVVLAQTEAEIITRVPARRLWGLPFSMTSRLSFWTSTCP